MKNIKILLSIALFLVSVTLSAQTLRDSVSIFVNHKDGLYEKGEIVKVWAEVKAIPEYPVYFYIIKGCDRQTEIKTEITLHKGENVLFEDKVDETVQYVFELSDGANPNDFKDPKAKGNVFAGVVVDPNGFEIGFDEPSDVLTFWENEITSMRRQKVKATITNDETKDGFRTYHVDINCVGPAPCRAYVSHPAGAKDKSLPIILNLHSAGSPGAPSKASVALSYAEIVENGALAMDLNAHGMLDDMPAEYYKELSRGELNGYSKREPMNKDDYYFKWMLLRAQRALDYLCSNPLWDGKHVIVTGASQGGYQSAFLASMDPRVTTAILTVPAGLDQGAKLKGRRSSWPATINKYPESTKTNSPYFDPATFLKYTKASIWCEIGLYDFTCPAANILAALNTVNSQKTIITYQRPHSVEKGLGKAHTSINNLRKQAFQAAVEE